jgi:hypothetical protein
VSIFGAPGLFGAPAFGFGAAAPAAPAAAPAAPQLVPSFGFASARAGAAARPPQSAPAGFGAAPAAAAPAAAAPAASALFGGGGVFGAAGAAPAALGGGGLFGAVGAPAGASGFGNGGGAGGGMFWFPSAPPPPPPPPPVSAAAAAAAAAMRAAVGAAAPQPASTAAGALPAGAVLAAAVARLDPGIAVAPAATQPADAALTWDAAHAAEALLGLAVQPSLRAAPLAPCAAGLDARAAALLDALTAGSLARDAAARLTGVHVAHECVLCLESAPPPDTVFIPCGHQCVHWEEAERLEACPLCRAFISARLCVADGRFAAAPTRPARVFPVRNAAAVAAKPVVYLYPPRAMRVGVTVRLARGAAGARFTALVPTPTRRDGEDALCWDVLAAPSGILRAAPPPGAAPAPPVASLFWEADLPAATMPSSPSASASASPPPLALSPGHECFCVPGAALGDALLRALRRRGLAVREYTEMASFWAARLGHHPFVVGRLLRAGAELDAGVAALHIAPQPDTLLRVYLLARGVDAHQAWATAPMEEEEGEGEGDGDVAAGCERSGFTAVEWGGSEV